MSSRRSRSAGSSAAESVSATAAASPGSATCRAEKLTDIHPGQDSSFDHSRICSHALLQHPDADRHDLAGLLGEVDELARAEAGRASGGSSATALRHPRWCRRAGRRSVGSAGRTRRPPSARRSSGTSSRRWLACVLVEERPARFAPSLGPVHRGVGIVEQELRIDRARLVAGDGHDPDAHRHRRFEVVERDGSLDEVANARPEGRGILDTAEAFAHDDELVATGPGDGVGFSQRPLEAARDLDQHPVAAFVPHRVVHDLERVEVAEQHRGHVVRPRGAGQRDRQTVHEEQPVREPGERVVQRELDELALGRLAVGDVPRVRDDAAHGRVLEAVRVDGLEPAPHAALVADPQLRGWLGDVGLEEPGDQPVAGARGRPGGSGLARSCPRGLRADSPTTSTPRDCSTRARPSASRTSTMSARALGERAKPLTTRVRGTLTHRDPTCEIRRSGSRRSAFVHAGTAPGRAEQQRHRRNLFQRSG